MRLIVGLKKLGLLIGITVLLLAAGPFAFLPATAGTNLPNRFLKISDSKAAHTNVTYQLGFDTPTSDTVGSVELELCSNDPFPGTSCTVPAGLDVSGASLLAQSGTNDFLIDVGSTNAHKIVFSRTPSVVAATSYMFEFNNVVNPSSAGSEYARIRIFSAPSGGGTVNDSSGLAFVINADLTISTQVPPHIDLCVGVTVVGSDCSTVVGDTIDLGILKTNATATGTSQFMAATNADNGYTITLSGSTMTSGNNLITPLNSLTTSNPGINQFGMNLRKNTVPNIGAEPTGVGTAAPIGNYAIPDNFTYKSGDVIVSVAGPDNFRKFTATYIINIDDKQPAGFYATTVSFIALGNF